MYCPKCGAELNDGSIICNVCGEHFAMEQQKGRFLAAKNRTLAILSDIFHSQIFLIFSIFTSILCGVGFISIFMGGGIEAILTFVLSLIAVIACWKTYTAKTAPDAKNISKIRGLLKAWRIFSKVLYILLIVCLVMIIICAVIFGFTWEATKATFEDGEFMRQFADVLLTGGLITQDIADELTSGAIDAGDVIGKIIAFFIFRSIIELIVYIPFYIIYGIMLKKAENYVLELENTCTFGTYRAEKSPGKFMLVMGIIYAAITLGATTFARFNIGSFEMSNSMPNILPAAIGAFLICAGILFNKIHAVQMENNACIAQEEAELARVAQLTNAAIIEATHEAETVIEASAVEETPVVVETPIVEEPTNE